MDFYITNMTTEESLYLDYVDPDIDLSTGTADYDAIEIPHTSGNVMEWKQTTGATRAIEFTLDGVTAWKDKQWLEQFLAGSATTDPPKMMLKIGSLAAITGRVTKLTFNADLERFNSVGEPTRIRSALNYIEAA